MAEQAEQDQEFVGFQPAADYLGLKRNTLSGYCSRGVGPSPARSQIEAQYVLPVFLRSELDRWKRDRPGQGKRTDLEQVGE